MFKRYFTIAPLAVLITVLLQSTILFAHCEVPCGIYDDEMRFTMLREDIQTIDKAMQQISALSTEATPNWNQIVRWVMTKETHADKISETVTEYFLKQRIMLHKIMVTSMKCKQTLDLENVKALNKLVDDFYKAYFGTDADPQHEHQ
jgi:nickel superoxide dismutase